MKNVILASSDQVAIDAISAQLMGFNPLDIKFIRIAHEMGLGCGNPRDIEIVGDTDAADQRWNFVGPYEKMTFRFSDAAQNLLGRVQEMDRMVTEDVVGALGVCGQHCLPRLLLDAVCRQAASKRVAAQ